MKRNRLKLSILVISIVLLISIVINIRSVIKENHSKQKMEALDYKTETNLTYAVEVEKETSEYIVACLIFEDNVEGIEEIESPNGNKINTTGKTKIALDYKLERETDRTFKIKSKNGEITTININASDYVYSGDGTEANPYIIKTAVLLQRITKELDAHYRLGANIDLTGKEWTVIGNEETPFSGSIDGAGFTISNLTVESTGDNVGLFGKSTGVIKNVKVESFNVKGNNNVGAIVGKAENAITDCKVTGSTVIGTGENVGGVVGNTTSTITGATGTEIVVEGTGNVGGLVGQTTNAVSTVEVSGTVTGSGDNVGGAIGYTTSNVTGVKVEAEVTGANQVGGAIGYSYGGARTITKAVATGKVTGRGDNVGGLIGYVNPWYNHKSVATINIENVYETGKVEGTENVGGLIGYIYREKKRVIYSFGKYTNNECICNRRSSSNRCSRRRRRNSRRISRKSRK